MPEDPFEKAERLALAAVENEALTYEYHKATKHAQSLEGAPGWKGNGKKMTQVEKILNHIVTTGYITQREAYLDYNIQSFHRRIADIRELGIELHTENRRHPTTGQEYSRYSFVSVDDLQIAKEMLKVAA